METIRWGIIGCGDVTEIKSGPGLQRAEGSSLVAVMRRDAAKAADYAKRHGVPAWYDDADRLIADPNVDIVYVATPPSSHAEYTCRAAAVGKPVYVEKPMATTADECRRMISSADAAGVKLFVAYYRRCLPRFVKAKQLIDDCAIGDVRAVTATLWRPAQHGEMDGSDWRVNVALSGGGVFVDLASHTLDLIDHLCGPIVSAGGVAHNGGGLYAAEDTVAGHWQHASGAVGNGSWCFTAGANRDEVDIVGSRGMIRFSTFGDRPVILQTAAGTAEFAIPHPPHVQQPLIQTIVDDLRGRGTCPSTGTSGLRTAETVDAMLAGWRATRR